ALPAVRRRDRVAHALSLVVDLGRRPVPPAGSARWVRGVGPGSRSMGRTAHGRIVNRVVEQGSERGWRSTSRSTRPDRVRTMPDLRVRRAVLLLAVVTVTAAIFAPSGFARGQSRVTLVGTVQVVHADYFKADHASYAYRLHTTHGYVRLRVSGRAALAYTGRRVAVRGVRAGRSLFVASNGFKAVGRRTAAAADASGTHRVLVLLVNFQDKNTQPFTTSDIYAREFTNSDSVNQYYQQESFGKVSLTGEVHGWYTIPVNQAGQCNWSSWGDAADTAAQNDGV